MATKDGLARVEERIAARFDSLTERFDLKLGSATNQLRAPRLASRSWVPHWLGQRYLARGRYPPPRRRAG